MIQNKQPAYSKTDFECPHCHVYAHQIFQNLNVHYLVAAFCQHCKDYSLWVHEKMVYPLINTAPLPNPDMSDECKNIFNEARKISNLSYSATAALLRLCVEKLIEELDEKNGDLNDRIGNLVKDNKISLDIQKALDTVRVIGNEAIHAGQIDPQDTNDTVLSLFDLVNFIVEDTISKKKKIEELFKKLPKAKRNGIKQRDKK